MPAAVLPQPHRKYLILRWICCVAVVSLPAGCHALSTTDNRGSAILSPITILDKGIDEIVDGASSSNRHQPNVPKANKTDDERHPKILSRRKRFLAFPLGSSFSTAVCMTTGVIGNPEYSYLSMGLNWGIAYDLPNSTWVLDQTHGLQHLKGDATNSNVSNDDDSDDKRMEMVAVPTIKRRHRRDLYGKMETLIDSADTTSHTTTPEPSHIMDELKDHRQQQQQQQQHYDLLLPKVLLEKSHSNCNDTAMSSITTGRQSSLMAVEHTQKQQQHDPQHRQILSRHKRYLSFPEGSSLSVAVCFTVGIIGNPSRNYMSFGLNWGVAYDLPNTSWVLNHLHGFSKHTLPPPTAWRVIQRRRSRRAVYQEIEMFIENMGYNGRDCVLRALCESRQYFQRNKMTMVGEMLRAVFSLPKQRIFTREIRENADIVTYDRAYRKARSTDCEQEYDCKFSLLELAFGKYSTPPEGYYENH